MKWMLLACLMAVSHLAMAQPQVIAYWAQNDNGLDGGGFGFRVGDFPQAADVGAGTLSLVDFNTSADSLSVYECIQSFAGSTLNAQSGFPAGGSLSVQGCDDTSNNGMHIELKTDTRGLKDIEISWAWRGTSSGFDQRTLSWSLDGQTFEEVGSDTGRFTEFRLRTYDLSDIEAINDQAEVYFRITLDGATSATGNNRFDNITILGSPEGSDNGADADAAIPYSITFDNNPYTMGWSNQDLSGLPNWDWNSTFLNVTFSAFSGGSCTPTESWFISPGFDLDAQTGERLFVDLQRGFAGGDDPLTLWFSDSYSGSGNPNEADWVLLDTITPANFSSNNLTVTFGPYTELRELSGTGYFAARGLYERGGCGTYRMTGLRIDTEEAVAPLACTSDPATDTAVSRVHAIQGDGPASPKVGQEVEVQAIVVGAFQDSSAGQIGGFFVQEPDDRNDDNPLTSEGLYVSPEAATLTLPTLAIGEEVRLRGVVREQFGQTELFQVSAIDRCADDQLERVSPAILELPVDDLAELEAVEGMWVRLPQSLTVTTASNAARFAELTVAPERLFAPTQVVAPGDEAQARAALNDRSRLIIDQGRTGSYRTPFMPGQDGTALNASNPIRAGHRLPADFDGIMGFGFSNYRLFALQDIRVDAAANPRREQPVLPQGDLTVATYNVENLFLTLAADGVSCGPSTLSCRGASSDAALNRQLAKLTSALLAMDADLIGLIEIENDADDATLTLLVDLLNDQSEPADWAFISTGFKGSDAIKNALIYRSNQVVPVGPPAILDRNVAVTPAFDDRQQRPVLKQAFRHADHDDLLTVSVFHLRSKNCTAGANGGNADQEDGQGCWNALRTQSVEAFLSWLDSDPTGANTDKHLLLGDFNAHAQEDPLQRLSEAGFVNETVRSNRDDPAVYTFVFQGEAGSLDHVLASSALSRNVLGATTWPINADELPAFAYPLTLPASSLNKPEDFYQGDAFRSSDHDPVLASIKFSRPAITDVRGSLSGSWYDVSRDGEGFVFEFGDNPSGPAATVFWFTHRDGVPYWLIGSVEVDVERFDEIGALDIELLEVSGTGFGDAFNPSELSQHARGRLRFVFDACDQASAIWHANGEGNELGTDSLSYQLRRITLGLDGVACADNGEDSRTASDDTLPALQGALSGAWFDEARNGEGFVLEFGQNPDSAVATVYWFTHRDGVPYWLIGIAPYGDDEPLLDVELLEVSGTGFGQDFDADAIDIEAVGRAAFSFTRCTAGLAIWDKQPGQSGSFDLRRITRGLDGAACR